MFHNEVVKHLLLLFLINNLLFGQEVSTRINGPQIDLYYKYQREYLRLLFYTNRDYCINTTYLLIQDKSLPVLWQTFEKNSDTQKQMGEDFLSDEQQRVIAKNEKELIRERKFLGQYLKKCPDKEEIKEVCKIWKEEPSAFPVGLSPGMACELLDMRGQIKSALLNAQELKRKLERGEIDFNSFNQTVLGLSTDIKEKISALPQYQQKSAASTQIDAPLISEISKTKEELMENLNAELDLRNEQQALAKSYKKQISVIEETIQRHIIDGKKDSPSYYELLKAQSKLQHEAANSIVIQQAHEQKIKELDEKIKGISDETSENKSSNLNDSKPMITNQLESMSAEDIKPELNSIDKLLGLDRFRASLLYEGKGDGDL